jgi:hypothetical protein
LCGPLADAGDVAKSGDGPGKVAVRFQQTRIRSDGFRDARQRCGTGFGYSQVGQDRGFESIPSRKNVRETWQTERLNGACAERANNAAGKSCRRLQCDLLTQDSADGRFETVPTARHA